MIFLTLTTSSAHLQTSSVWQRMVTFGCFRGCQGVAVNACHLWLYPHCSTLWLPWTLCTAAFGCPIQLPPFRDSMFPSFAAHLFRSPLHPVLWPEIASVRVSPWFKPLSSNLKIRGLSPLALSPIIFGLKLTHTGSNSNNRGGRLYYPPFPITQPRLHSSLPLINYYT